MALRAKKFAARKPIAMGEGRAEECGPEAARRLFAGALQPFWLSTPVGLTPTAGIRIDLPSHLEKQHVSRVIPGGECEASRPGGHYLANAVAGVPRRHS